MKKIFIIFLILFVGLLVGCASKPVVVKDFSTSFETYEEEKKVEKQIKYFTNDKISEFVYNPSISMEDINKFIRRNYNYSYNENLHIQESDYVILITNTTNKTIHLRLILRFFTQYPQNSDEGKKETEIYETTITEDATWNQRTRCFDVMIPANKSKKIRIPNAISLKENLFNIYDIDNNNVLFNFQSNNIDPEPSNYLSQTEINEIYRTHSLELIYNIDNSIIKFISPIDCNDQEVELAERKWFNKYGKPKS